MSDNLKKDPVTETRLSFIYPGIADGFRSVDRKMWDRYRLRLRCTEGIRTNQVQEILWAKGRTQLENGCWAIINPKEVKTHAMPGDCLHGYGLAFDFCFWGDDPYLRKIPNGDSFFKDAADFIEEAGMVCGRSWPQPLTDPDHAENMYHLNIHQIKSLAQVGGNRAVWAEINKRLGMTAEIQGELL